MDVLRSLDNVTSEVRRILWPLVWLGDNRPYVFILMLLSLFLVLLLVAVNRKIAYDKRFLYRLAAWRKERPVESLGWGLRRLIAVVVSVTLMGLWLFITVLALVDLALIAPAIKDHLGYVLAPLGLLVVATWFLITFHTLFISRMRANKEVTLRSAHSSAVQPVAGRAGNPAAVPPVAATPAVRGTLGYRDGNYPIGYGTGITAIVLDVLYIAIVLGVFAWLASLAA